LDINQKKKMLKFFGFGVILFVLLITVLFLLGFNVLSFPFPPTYPPAGAIIDFSPLYNLAFWYLLLRLMVTIGEKIILRTDSILETPEQKETKKSDM